MLPSFELISDRLAVWSGWLGLGLIGAAGLVLLADLGAPSRCLRVFSRPRRSWLSRGAWNMLLLGVGLLAWLPALPGLEALPWQRETPLGFALEAAVVVLAVGLMTYTGLLLSSWNAIPFWNTPLLPALFVTSALLSATGAMLLLVLLTGPEAGGLATLALALIVVLSFHLGLYLVVMRSASATARASTCLLLSGSESRAFLGGVVVVGLLAPAALLLLDLAFGFKSAGTSHVAAVAILLGTIQLRRVVLKVGVYRA